MLFSYNLLKKFFFKKLPSPQRLAKEITFHSFEVEKLEKRGDDWIFDIDITANRGSDCLSHFGLAREISAIFGFKFKEKIKPFKERGKLDDFIKIKVENFSDCRRYMGALILDTKIAPSLKWLSKILENLNINSINNIVDLANLSMILYGQPLHVFDFDKIKGKRIFIRRAKRGEGIVTLEGEKFSLDKEILVIADGKGPIAIAGIKGGENSKVDKGTKNIFIESANFNPYLIRKARKKLKLTTESSLRFEYGLDLMLSQWGLLKMVDLILKFCGGNFIGVVDLYSQERQKSFLKLEIDYLADLLGISLKKEKIKKILNNLGFQIEKEKKNFLILSPPLFRKDIEIKEDVIEEVGRIYGYDKIKPSLPKIVFLPPKENEKVFWRERIRDILTGSGFDEIYTHSFIGEKEKEEFNFKEAIEVLNPTSGLYKYLRPSLISNLLKSLEINWRNFKKVKIFEIGKIFKKEKDKIKEEEKISLLLWEREKKDEGFFLIKGTCDLLFEKLAIEKPEYLPLKKVPSFFHPLNGAEIFSNKEKVGLLGEFSPKILKKRKIEGRVFVLEVDFSLLSKLATEEYEFEKIPPWPPILRDLSIVVPEKTKVADLLNEIHRLGKGKIRDVELFDIYEMPQLKGKISYAFHIIYQSYKEKLTPEMVNEIHQKIIKGLEENIGWEVRK